MCPPEECLQVSSDWHLSEFCALESHVVRPCDYLCWSFKLNDESLCVQIRRYCTPTHTHTYKGQLKSFLKQVVSDSSLSVCCQIKAGRDHLSAEGECEQQEATTRPTENCTFRNKHMESNLTVI